MGRFHFKRRTKQAQGETPFGLPQGTSAPFFRTAAAIRYKTCF